jgi:DNA-binding NarL/FixJ family response regulator
LHHNQPVNNHPPISAIAMTRPRAPASDALRVVIVATDTLTRAGLASILAAEQNLLTVGQVDPRDELQDLRHLFHPDILLWDIGYAGESDLDTLATYLDTDSSAPALPVLALLADGDAAAAAWNAGVRALVPRRASASTLIAALHAAAAGLIVLDPEAATQVVTPFTGAAHGPTIDLTAREHEVLHLLAQGLPNKTIARRLAISEHTVKFHVNAILAKFGAQSRTEAVVLASRAGLILL